MNLRPRAKELLKQWRESNPQLVKDLEKSGDLNQSLDAALNRELDVYAQAIEKGLNPDQARELAREELDLPTAQT